MIGRGTPACLLVLILSLSVLGCGRTGEPVALLTGVDADACYAGGETGMGGLLVVDADYGTRFNGKPVMWPEGFTGIRAGNEVVVLDASGKVVATTGRKYFISIAPVLAPESQQLIERTGAYPAAAHCDYPWDFVDCGTPRPASAESDVPEPSCGYHSP